jgi:monoamine oxidase
MELKPMNALWRNLPIFILALMPINIYANCGNESKPCEEVATVVGAGFSGSVAAYELNKAGIDVHLYEARDRIGGRVYSKKKYGILLEEGALFIDSDHEYVFRYMELAKLNKLDKWEPKHSGYKVVTTYMLNGKSVSNEAFYRYFKPIIEFLGKKPYSDKQLNKMTYSDLVYSVPNVKKKLKDEFLAYADQAIASEYGESPKDINAIIFYDMMTWEPKKNRFIIDGQIGDERFRIKEGNQSIAIYLTKKIPKKNIHLKTRLEKVTEQSDGQYLLRFNSKEGAHWVRTRYLALAAPIHLYHNLESNETEKKGAINLKINNIPASTKEAFQQIEYGANHKLMLFFKGDVWQNSKEKREYLEIFHPYFHAWNGGKGTDNDQYSVVTLFISGREAKKPLSKSNIDAMAYQFIEGVHSILPNVSVKNLIKVEAATHWPTDEFSRGSYAGGFKKGEAGKYEYWIKNPRAGNLVFTGSEWSEDWYGFMNGALENGYKSAQYLISRINDK